MSSFVDARRKDVEALVEANKGAYEAMQAMVRKQTEMLTQAMQSIQESAKGLTSGQAGVPDATKQAEVVRAAWEKMLGDMTKLAEMAQKAQAEIAAPATAETAAGSKARVTVIKRELAVPSLGDELTTSSVIVADKVDVLQAAISPEKQRENPYTFGQMKITPSEMNKFAKTDDLNIVFWIYGAQLDPGTKKPNVTVDYSFSQKTASGEKYFNKTDPQELNATTLPPQFDLAAGHQLPGSLQVPLASFPEGDYHLEIKVADKVSGKSITRDVTFTIAPPVQ